jgi:hypothetical protein
MLNARKWHIAGRLLAAAFAILAASSALSSSSAPDAAPAGDTATHKFATYIVKTPKDWQRKDDPIVAFHAAPSGTKLFPNVKVAIVKLPPSFTMMDSVNASKKAYASIWKIESEESTKLGGWQAQRLVLTQEMGLVKSKQLKYFIAAENQVLIFTGQTTHETFDVNLPLFEAVARTLAPAN